MVFVWLLGAIDVLCAISLAAAALGYPLPHLQAGAAFMLLVKGFMFITDVVSVLDVIAALCMFWLLWQSSMTLALGLAVYLGLKGLLSFK